MENKTNLEFVYGYCFINRFVNDAKIDRIVSNHCGIDWKKTITFNELLSLLDISKDIFRTSKTYLQFSDCVNDIASYYVDKPIDEYLKENAYCVTSGMFKNNS